MIPRGRAGTVIRIAQRHREKRLRTDKRQRREAGGAARSSGRLDWRIDDRNKYISREAYNRIFSHLFGFILTTAHTSELGYLIGLIAGAAAVAWQELNPATLFATISRTLSSRGSYLIS